MRLWRKYLTKWRFRQPGPSCVLEVLPGVFSSELDNRRDVLVALPASYSQGDRRYPVVYMQDGQNLFDPKTSFAGDWGLGDALANAAREGAEPIVVAVPNMGAERINEYSPFVDPVNGGGQGDRYVDFLIRTLKPVVDQVYRTRPEPAGTGIAGSSMGALISLYAFLRNPEVFGFAGILSPSIWFANGAILPYAEQTATPRGRIYLDVGTAEGGETLQRARELRDTLIRKGYRLRHDLRWVEERGGRHHESTWGRRFGRALPFLLSEA